MTMCEALQEYLFLPQRFLLYLPSVYVKERAYQNRGPFRTESIFKNPQDHGY